MHPGIRANFNGQLEANLIDNARYLNYYCAWLHHSNSVYNLHLKFSINHKNENRREKKKDS